MWKEKYRNQYFHPEFDGSVGIRHLKDHYGNSIGLCEVTVRGVDYAFVKTDNIDILDETKVLDWVLNVCFDDTHLGSAYICPYLDGREYELTNRERLI